MEYINFNKPYLSGREMEYIHQAVVSMKISGDGIFTKKCHDFFEKRYGFMKVFLTTSCTDALEMASILIGIKENDEVIIPSFTFVSTANAFLLRGARIIFCDSGNSSPNINVDEIESLITPRTKAIILVHYAGVACDMDKVMTIAKKHNLYVIEDAAHSIDSFYKGKPLGSFGHLAAFSFHETKNVISGEGGMLVINDAQFIKRAEIIREKGTNRSAFFRGEIDKYNWVDIGSSFLPSDIIAAFLYAQLENMDTIQKKRKFIWEKYYQHLKPLEGKNRIRLPSIPSYATNNAHMFYIICKTRNERDATIRHLKKNNIHAVFHYLSLHSSPFFKEQHGKSVLRNSDYYSDCLIRLPMYYDLNKKQIKKICDKISELYLL